MTIDDQLNRLFSASRVAVVGASTRNPHATGNQVIRNLRSRGFSGSIAVAHPSGEEVEGIPSVASISELPVVDLAVVAVGPTKVVDAVAELERAGCPAVIILSVAIEPEALAELSKVRERGAMLVHGPNCMGIISVNDALSVWAEEGNLDVVLGGDIALVSQSGSGAIFVARSAQTRGFSRIVSTGNEVALTTADYIGWLADDDQTSVIGIIVESIPDVAAFRAAVARARHAGKPVVALKIGRSESGATATAAHTGALLSRDSAYQALFEQLDVPLVADYDELASALELLSTLAGRGVGEARVGVVTISGGQAALAADLAATRGVALPELSAGTRDALESLFAGSSVHNPLDAGASVDSDEVGFARAVEILGGDPSIDVVVAVIDSQATLSDSEIAYEDGYYAHTLSANAGVPVVVASSSSHSLHARRIPDTGSDVAVLRGLSNTFLAIRSATRNRAPVAPIAQRSPEAPPAAVVESLRDRIVASPGPLTGELLRDVLDAYGIPRVASRVVDGPAEAAEFATSIGYPVVVKVESPDIAHRTEIGGVVTGISDDRSLREAIASIAAAVGVHRPGAHIDGYEVQAQISDAVEGFVGFVSDPVLGADVGVGMGGVLVELLDDAAHGLAPLTEAAARSLLDTTMLGRLLAGYRAIHPVTDLRPVADVVARVSHLADDLSDLIGEADFNPVLIEERTGRPFVVDALLVSAGGSPSGVPEASQALA